MLRAWVISFSLLATNFSWAIGLSDVFTSGLTANQAAYIRLLGTTLPAGHTVNLTSATFSFYTGVTMNNETCSGLQTGSDVTLNTGTYSFPVSSMPKSFSLNNASAYLIEQTAGATTALVACLELTALNGNVSGATGYEVAHSLAYNATCSSLTSICQAGVSSYISVEFQQ